MNSWRFCCDDFERAAGNRKMVRLKQNIIGYLEIEALVATWPRNVPLPESLLGVMPSLDKRSRKITGQVTWDDNWNGTVDNIVRIAEGT